MKEGNGDADSLLHVNYDAKHAHCSSLGYHCTDLPRESREAGIGRNTRSRAEATASFPPSLLYRPYVRCEDAELCFP